MEKCNRLICILTDSCHQDLCKEPLPMKKNPFSIFDISHEITEITSEIVYGRNERRHGVSQLTFR